MPLKDRNTIILLVGCILATIGIGYGWTSFFYTPVHKDIIALTAKVDDLNKKLQVAKARAQQLSALQQEMATLQLDVAELEKQLPKDRELPALLRVLTHRAESYGLSIATITPEKPVSKGLYDEIPYNLSVTSSYHSLGHFLTSMGKGDRLFATRNLSLTAAGKTDATKTVNATFHLVTFKYHG